MAWYHSRRIFSDGCRQPTVTSRNCLNVFAVADIKHLFKRAFG